MYEHVFIEHVGNFSVIYLAVILATAAHYAVSGAQCRGTPIERYPVGGCFMAAGVDRARH